MSLHPCDNLVKTEINPLSILYLVGTAVPIRAFTARDICMRERMFSPIIDRTIVCEERVCAQARGKLSRREMDPSMRKVTAACLVLSILGTCAVLLISSSDTGASLAYHAPISIVGDSGFASYPEISGSGTESDPYILSGFAVYASMGTGLYVQDTASYFVVKAMHFNSTAAGMMDPAIQFQNVSHVTIEASLINATTSGISVTDSDNVTVNDVDFLDYTGWGVSISSCEDISIMDSQFYGANGVSGSAVSRAAILSNQMVGVETGVMMGTLDNSTIQSNSFESCGYPVYLNTAERNDVVGNVMSGGSFGIELRYVYWSNVSGNEITGIEYTGIFCYMDSHNDTFCSNTISDGLGTGFLADTSRDCVVISNTFRNNDDPWAVAGGVWLRDCSGMLVYHNSFYENTPRHAYDSSATDNRWNETYPTGGNYWDNYTGADENSGADQISGDSDGIGDVPYQFDVDTSDSYPLVDALNTNTRPVASFTVTPASADAGEAFSVDASGCSDGQDSVDDLQVRWDWDGDGSWDSSFSTDKTATHTYLVPGTYTIRMEVLDTGGLSNVTSETVVVTGTVIPEFPSLVVPVLVIMALFLLVRRRQ